jgi:16S rRNA (cytidine1402-2'-O)-methyltransferase
VLILAATPLGNPSDASNSLKDAITNSKFIAAEDSRKLARLSSDLGITYSAKVISFFEGNETERIDELLTILKSGADLLVVTDAGMPGVSDPGYRLVRAAIENKIQIKVLPGPSAVTTALLISGLATDRFCFEGFAPRTSGARLSWYEELANEPRTIVFFEAPHRLVESLTDALTALGPERKVAVCRELTKTYEEIERGTLERVLIWAKSKEILGEITIVLEGFDTSNQEFTSADLVEQILKIEAAGLSRKEAIAEVAKVTGVAKRTLFDAMVEHKAAEGKVDL